MPGTIVDDGDMLVNISEGGAWGGKETINMKTNNQSFEMGNDLLPSPNRFEIIQNLKL